MSYETEKFVLSLVGSSTDLRTNKWRVTCKKCKRSHEPATTILSRQTIECKCGETAIIDYNKLQDLNK